MYTDRYFRELNKPILDRSVGIIKNFNQKLIQLLNSTRYLLQWNECQYMWLFMFNICTKS